MLGTMRLLLSGLVLVNHLWEPAENMIGYHAVAAFYITSGYLMMRVIHEVYGTDRAGVSAFLVNRALRILPGYWLFLALTLAVVELAPPAFHYTSLLKVPVTTSDWIANVFLVDLVWANAILVPPAWSLGIEAVFYILMPLVLARTAAITAWWLAASLAITAAMIAVEAGFGYRYYPAYAASVFFSAGAMCYVVRERLKGLLLPMPVLPVLVVIFAASPLLARAAGLDPLWAGYYGGAALYLVMLTTLVMRPSPLGARVDAYLGDLAYPVFLSHFLAACLVKGIAFQDAPTRTTTFLILSAAMTVALSVVYLHAFDRPLQRIRARVRPAQSAAQRKPM